MKYLTTVKKSFVYDHTRIVTLLRSCMNLIQLMLHLLTRFPVLLSNQIRSYVIFSGKGDKLYISTDVGAVAPNGRRKVIFRAPNVPFSSGKSPFLLRLSGLNILFIEFFRPVPQRHHCFRFHSVILILMHRTNDLQHNGLL